MREALTTVLWLNYVAELSVGKTLGLVYSLCVSSVCSLFFVLGSSVNCDFTPKNKSQALVSLLLVCPAKTIAMFLSSLFAPQVYDGGWLDGQRSGTGSLCLPGGDVFEGLWLNDKKEGPGERRERFALAHQECLQNLRAVGATL